MSNWPKPHEVSQYYGNPVGRDGLASPKWQSANLVKVKVPWRMVLAWQPDKVAKTVTVHRLVAPSVERIFAAIWAAADQQQAVIEQWGMHLYGGGWTSPRPQRGGSRLSLHAYGAALDFDPDRNKMGDATPNFANVPEVLKAFADEGWKWGGRFRTPDGMHWEATSS